MQNLYKQFKTDKNRETSGIEIQYGEDTVFRIARAGGANKAYLKELNRATKPYRKALQHNSMDEKLSEKIYIEVFVKTVLLGWEGVTDEEGNPLAYNQENAIKLFTDLPELFLDLREQAENASLFMESLREDELGNLKNTLITS